MMKKTIAIALLLAAACSKQSAAPPANEAEPAANATTLVENEAPLNPPALEARSLPGSAPHSSTSSPSHPQILMLHDKYYNRSHG